MKAEYGIGLALVVFIGIGLMVLFATPDASQSALPEIAGTQREPYKELANPSGFLNTEPFTLKGLIGKKVILIDFLTYSCINCQRTFPYLNAWYEKYKDQGLEIVGIHTPEFAFEKDIDNVREAMARFGITHPIVLDNDYATWRAYGNQYWPRKYLIDIHGAIVYDHIGEGAYEETEMKVRELLAERAKVFGEQSSVREGALASDAMPETAVHARSPETYFGSLRNEYFINGRRSISGEQTLAVPSSIIPNALYLSGTWSITPEYAESVSGASVFCRYNAREVYLVAEADTPVEIEIRQDGVTKIMTIRESKLYTIISNLEPGEHLLEIRVRSGKVRLYAFTFG